MKKEKDRESLPLVRSLLLLLSQTERAEGIVVTGTAVLSLQVSMYKSRTRDDKMVVQKVQLVLAQRIRLQ
jgi:hypothetical protein